MSEITQEFVWSLARWLTCIAVGLGLHFGGLLGAVDRQWLDWEFSIVREYFPQPADTDVVIIGVDEDFLRAAPEPVALLHRHFSALFKAVAAGKPRLTGLDIVLPEKSFSFLVPVAEPEVDFDKQLATGLLELGAVAPLVVGETWDSAHGRFREIHPAFLAAASQWVGKRGPQGFDNRGSALLCPDADSVVREYPGATCQPNRTLRTLSGQMASLLGVKGPFGGHINFAVGGMFSYLPAGKVIDWHKSGDANKLAQLNGKAVLIGIVLDNEDRLRAPVAMAQWEPGNHFAAGITLQAQILRSLLNQGLVKAASPATIFALILVAGALCLGRSIAIKVLLLCLLTLGIGLLSLMALVNSVRLPVAAIFGTGFFAVSWSATLAGIAYWRERRHLLQTFSGYVSPPILKDILSGELVAGQVGKRVNVCVVFSDIRDFTTLAERMPPDLVVKMLNAFFGRMSAIVHRHGGLVDKFTGDGMMILFGTPQLLACAEKNALEAAGEMMLAVEELNLDFVAAGLAKIGIGIGLHSGEAIVGHLGSEERHEYTAIGDTVNVAARVCGLPKVLGYPIVCTEAVATAVGYPDYLIDNGMQAIKGRSDIRVYGWNP